LIKKNYKTIVFLLVLLNCCFRVNPVAAVENDDAAKKIITQENDIG